MSVRKKKRSHGSVPETKDRMQWFKAPESRDRSIIKKEKIRPRKRRAA